MRDLRQRRGRRVVWLAVMLLPLVAGAAHRTELRAESRVQENGGPGRNLGDDPGRPATEPGAGAFHALLIAVDDYRHAQVEDLDHPVSDAARLRAVLTEDYGFRPENVRVLENASEDEILTSLWRLHQTVTGADSVLLFFAGHGIWKPDIEQGYWLPADATRASPARWISNSDIRDSIRGLGARHTLLISDACFSGSLFKTRKAFSEAGQAIQELYRLPSRKAMTSGTLSEVPDRSVFMEYLTKKLRENREPWVSADELFFGFRQAVINNGSATPQYGVIHGTGDEGGEFIFVRSGEAPPVPSVPPVPGDEIARGDDTRAPEPTEDRTGGIRLRLGVPVAVLGLGLRPHIRELYPQLAERSVGFGIHNMLLDHLFEADRFRFVEDSPEVLEDLIQRQWQSASGAVSSETAVRRGLLLGARYVAYGEVSQFTSQKVKKNTYETRIRIQVRMVDVETAELVPASGTGVLTRKGKIFSQSDPVEFARSTVGEATDAALEEAVAGLLKRLPSGG